MNGWRATAVAAGIAAIGLTIIFQGWRSRNPDWDVTHAMVQAVAIVERGDIPARGNLTDYNSFFPPGTTWLTVPGVLLFDDPRLVELSATGFLYVLTLLGVWLVGRRYFGTPAALLALALYAVSPVALRLGTELWPRGHPVFYIWLVFFASRWVDRRQPWYLAAALLTWSSGLYVHFEAAPAIVILPAIWWYYRPPIRWPPLALAGGLAVAMWWPYLTLQWQRGFIDVRSQVMRRYIDERGDEIFGCGHVVTANPRLLPADTSTGEWLIDRGPAIADLLLANLSSRVLAGEFILLFVLGAAMIVMAAPLPAPAPSRGRGMAIALAAIAVSVLAVEFTIRWVVAPEAPAPAWLSWARRLHVGLLVGVAVWAMGDAGVRRTAADFRSTWPRARDASLLAVALVAPWVVLLILTEPGRTERMSGLWPLQALCIAGGVTAAIARVQPAGWRRSAVRALLVAVVAANLVTLARARDWSAHGWAGRPAPVVAAGFRTLECD